MTICIINMICFVFHLSYFFASIGLSWKILKRYTSALHQQSYLSFSPKIAIFSFWISVPITKDIKQLEQNVLIHE